MESREDKSLFQNHVFIFKISTFTTSICLLIILLFFMRNHKVITKNIKVVKLEILKVKTWFCDKDLSSLDSIN